MCLGIVMVAASYFAATHSGGLTMMISWFGVPFFTLALAIACIQLFRRGPSLVMNAEGISGPRIGAMPLRWSDISAVSVGQIRRQKFLCLWLRDQDAYVSRLPAARQFAAKGNIALGFPALSLSFNGLDPGLDRALEYARTHVPEKTDAD